MLYQVKLRFRFKGELGERHFNRVVSAQSVNGAFLAARNEFLKIYLGRESYEITGADITEIQAYAKL